MLRSGFILGVSAPAALLTILVQPVVRDTADRWTAPVPTAQVVYAPLPGMRPVSLAISPTRIAGVQKSEGGVTPVAGEAQELGIEPILKAPRATHGPRRLRDRPQLPGRSGSAADDPGPLHFLIRERPPLA